jgi:predicted DCC family thiol-disulfide oxidoreductase YuxK
VNQKIIFFDGLCGLCNGFVDFMLKVDKKGIFSYSPLQSEYAAQVLPIELREDLKTVVVMIDGKIYKKSEAIQKIFAELGGGWSLIGKNQLFPRSVLNLGYDVVANNRYKLFGKKDSCRLPTPEERARFL